MFFYVSFFYFFYFILSIGRFVRLDCLNTHWPKRFSFLDSTLFQGAHFYRHVASNFKLSNSQQSRISSEQIKTDKYPGNGYLTPEIYILKFYLNFFVCWCFPPAFLTLCNFLLERRSMLKSCVSWPKLKDIIWILTYWLIYHFQSLVIIQVTYH